MANVDRTYEEVRVSTFEDELEIRMREVRDLLFEWGGIPDWHSATDDWLAFACEAARHVSEYLRGENLVLSEGERLTDAHAASVIDASTLWAEERAAWETCGENRRRMAAYMCADLDLAGKRNWYESASNFVVDNEADRQPTPLLAEMGRAAGRAYFAAYRAAFRAYCFGDDRSRDLILNPYGR